MLPNEALVTTPGLLLRLTLAIENTDIMLQMVVSGRSTNTDQRTCAAGCQVKKQAKT